MRDMCAFCPDPATTGEHLWSDWLSELLGSKNKYLIRRSVGGVERHWKSVGLREKAPVLCDVCNNEWGSRIETDMKKVVADMCLHGAPTDLTEQDVATIITFGLLKMMVGDCQEIHGHLFFDRTERRSFRRTLAIPKGTNVWLAFTPPGHGVYKGAYVAMDRKGPFGFEIYVFTVSMGRFVIQLATPRWYKKSKRRHASPPTLTQALIWGQHSVCIFPGRTFPIHWPPVSELGGQLLDEYVDRWRKLQWGGR
jgi:hypothetical protein